MENKNEIRSLLLEAASELGLLKYQLNVCQAIIGYISARLFVEKIPASDIDAKIMETYNKVMNAKSYEQAEAHFVGLADKICNEIGIGDFDSFKKSMDSFLGGMNNNNKGEL